ncbi:MAG TPA: GNAT family N-acetyltransferase [Candidatus Dormibacteraeota bacterium]
MQTAVRKATPADVPTLARTLAAAFFDDPVFSWLIPPRARSREKRFLAMFNGLAASYAAKGHSYLAGDDAAAAMWAPPGKWETPIGDILGSLVPFVGALRLRAIHSLITLGAVEGAHPKEPPHWYLGYLGTVPARQGQGLGGELLREVLTGVDEAGLPAYLESSNPRNLTLYQRHGFEVVEELHPPLGCPPIYRMWRDAGKGGG